MNSRIVSTKNTNAIFLATVLVLGTIVTISPSFMVGAQAEPYYEMDDRYDSYEAEYTDNNNYKPTEYPSYKPEYPSDNSYKSKDSSSTIVKKVKCNNINSNNNGVDVNLGIPNNDALVEAQAADNEGQATTANGLYGERNGYKKNDNDFRFICINNNDNINNIEQINPPPPPVDEDARLIVNKVVTCQPLVSRTNAIAACSEVLDQVQPNTFIIAISGSNSNPSEFDGSNIPVVVTLNPGNYQVTETADPGIATVISSIESGQNVIIRQSTVFSGNCNPTTGEGTIARGDFTVCTIQNEFTALPGPEGLTASNTNTDISAFDINTAGGLTASFSPPTIAQETEEDSSALAKIES